MFFNASFESNKRMLLLVLQILFLQFYSLCLGKKILLIGDSFDRGIAYHWCQHWNHTVGDSELHFHTWGDPALQYDDGHHQHRPYRLSPSVCIFENDSLATLHHYGSNANGPYFPNYFQTVPGVVVNTSERLETGLKNYLNEFGVPDTVYYNSIAWDHLAYAQKKGLFDINDFKKNTIERLNQIYSLLKEMKIPVENIDFGLRTTPTNLSNQKQTRQFSKIYYEIFQSNEVPFLNLFFDYDLDLWSAVSFPDDCDDIGIFFSINDRFHPTAHFAWRAGEKLLGRQYSSYLIYKEDNFSSSALAKNRHLNDKSWMHWKERNRRTAIASPNHVNLLRNLIVVHLPELNPSPAQHQFIVPFQYHLPEDGDSTLYERLYVHFEMPTRGHTSRTNRSMISYLWGPISLSSLRFLYLTAGDIYPNSIPTLIGSDIPPHLHIDSVPSFLSNSSKQFLVQTKMNQCYWIVEDVHIFVIPTVEIFTMIIRTNKIRGGKVSDVETHVDDYWFDQLLEPNDHLSASLFQNGSLVRLYNEKQCYYVAEELELRPINRVKTFFDHGWDFSQVQAIPDRRIFDLFQIGPPLT